MNALREMGYIAVGVGKTEFTVEIDQVLGEYALQKQQPPYLLAGNLLGVADGKNHFARAAIPRPAEGEATAHRPRRGRRRSAQVSVGVAGDRRQVARGGSRSREARSERHVRQTSKEGGQRGRATGCRQGLAARSRN